MKITRFFLYVLILTVFTCNRKNETSKESSLIENFRFSSSQYPKISVHRGGKGILGYPENCLETLEYVNDSISAIFEIDVAQTKDGHLILMHDNSLDRTTTGTGLVAKKNLSYIQGLYLKDDYNQVSSFKVPHFEDVLNWAKENDAVLTVDIKRSVSQKTVIDAIIKAKAHDQCIVITYDLDQAKSVYRLAPELMISVSARNMKEYQALLNSNIPSRNMIAFTGTRLSSKELYASIHSEDILCLLGTLGNLDKQAEARGDSLYKEWLRKGIDIIATDRPFEVYNAIAK